ncbi:MAG: ATP-binding protein, partial [Elusimicrobiota bacterium]
LQGAIFNSANFSSIATDAKGVIQIFNIGAERMLGYAAADVMNKITPADISDPQEVIARAKTLSAEMGEKIEPGFEALVFKASRGIEDFYELTYIRKDGSRFPAVVSVTALREAGNAIIGYLLIGTDNTLRKQAEVSLANTQRLESLGVLAGGIAHDFNNVLTAILGNLSLLQSELRAGGEAQKLLTQAHQELLLEAERACGTAKGLSNQLLTFAKGGSPVVTVMDLRLLLKEAAVFAARGSNVRCVFELSESPLVVNIDNNQVAQVIQNLILNAIQAMPGGGEIMVRAGLEGGSCIDVSFKDHGSGIQPKLLNRIFDPYFSTKAAGRGLGLAMFNSIMTKHGGSITADSTPGEGAVFTLRFPVAMAAYAPPEHKLPVKVAGKGNVLIMEDEAVVARVLKRMLEHLGYQAESVGDGRAAVDAYRQALEAGKPYDAVILDLTIPGGMGGKETIGQLLLLDPQAKVIVSSGYSNDPVVSDYSAHGFREVMLKPYVLEDVSEAMRRVLIKK